MSTLGIQKHTNGKFTTLIHALVIGTGANRVYSSRRMYGYRRSEMDFLAV